MATSETQVHFVNWLFSSSVKENDLARVYKFRLLVVITLVTGLLMWMYAFISAFFVHTPALTWIGFSCAIAHLFSPLVYKWSNSMKLAAYNMVTAGIIFQFSFSFYTGGFFAPTMIWFAILPMIVGILTDKFHTAIWTMISVGAVVTMYALTNAGIAPSESLSDLAKVVIQFMIALGLISLVGGFTLFFIEMTYFYHNKLSQNKELN